MPGEFNDLIPLPNRAPPRTFDEDILDADGLAGFIGGMQDAPARQPRRPVDPEVLDALGEVGLIGGIEDEPSAPAISRIPNDPAIDDPDGLGGFAASDGVLLRTGSRNDPAAVLRDCTGAIRQIGAFALTPVGQVAGKGVGLAIDKALGRFKNVPTLNAVNEAARTIFKSAGAAGVRVAQPAFRRFTTEATAFANRRKAFAQNAPGTARVLQSMERLSGKNPTFLELLRLRGSMRRVVERAKPGSADRRLVGTMLGRLDALMIGLSPRSVVSPDPRVARQMLPDISEFWRRSGNSQIIDDVFGQAKRRAGTNPKRKDVQIALRRGFLELAKDRARFRNFTKAEQDAIKRVAEGGPLQRFMVRIVNSLADPRKDSTKFAKFGGELIGTTAATTIGNTLDDKGAAAAGVVAATELGSRLPEATVAAGRALERGLIRRGARNVGLMVRSGGALPPPTPLAAETNALLRLGLAGQGTNLAEQFEEFSLPTP